MARWYESDFCGEQTDQGRALRAYLQEIRQSLREIRRVLREGGVVALALANSFRVGREFDLVSGVRRDADGSGVFGHISCGPFIQRKTNTSCRQRPVHGTFYTRIQTQPRERAARLCAKTLMQTTARTRMRSTLRKAR